MTGRIRDEDVAAVRAGVRIDEVIGDYVTLRPAGGGSLKGLCPFHDERSPSFHVTPSKGLFHCFGCQAGGDAITFLMEVDGMAFAEAVERLAARAGLQLRYQESGPSPRRDVGQRTRLVNANAAAATFYSEQLADEAGAPARAILQARGFDSEALRRFGVGYAPAGWQALADHLGTRGVTQSDMLTAGLVAQGRRGVYDRFRNRIIWPIRDAGGDVVGFGARRIDDTEDSPKYLNTPETPLYKKSQVLYGLDLARRSIAKDQEVVVVEGYTDVMAAHLAGITSAVATCGTAFAGEHVAVLRRFLMDDSTIRGRIIFTFDSDAAGRKAALRAFDLDQRFLAHTFVAVDARGLDPADLRLQHGDEAVRALIERRVPLFEFALRAAIDGVDVTTAEGRTEGLRAATAVLAGIRDDALRPEYARVVAGWLGMPETVVARSMGHAERSRGRGAGSRKGGPPGRASSSAGSGSRPQAHSRTGRSHGDGVDGRVEREALRAVVQVPAAAADWLDVIEPQALTDPAHRVILEALHKVGTPASDESGAVWAEKVMAVLPGEEERRFLRALLVEPIPAREVDASYVVSRICRLLDRDAQRRQAQLRVKMAQPDATEEAVRHDLLGQWKALEDYRVGLREHMDGGA